ncbi:MAG TPA: hypothetical protein VFE59_07905 [Trebonia sp.]|jgi:hypothetical protein|nr:hypothetical protein [Trebonia sp.]
MTVRPPPETGRKILRTALPAAVVAVIFWFALPRQRASPTGANCYSRVTASRKEGWPPAGQTGLGRCAILK